MALFGKKKATETDASQTKKAVATTLAQTASVTEAIPADILVRPLITEKAFGLSQQNVYTFLVSPSANAHQVRQAIRQVYKVTPKKVNMIRRQPRTKRSTLRNRTSHQPGYKKAYVYLNDGDTINLM